MNRLAVLVALLGFTGCAFGNRSVVLTYPPGTPRSETDQHTPTPNVIPQSSGKTILLVTFLDQRPSKVAIGAVHNGYGMHTADAIATNSVPGWVMNAIKLELRTQGFQVEDAADIPQTSDVPIVTGDVLQVMCQAYTRYESTVEFSVVVSSGGAIVLQKSYKGVDETTTNWGAGSDAFANSLAAALHTAADNFAVEFRRLSLLAR